MKLYDCCMYFDEDLILDLRLNTLNDHVDEFIIAEATRDHAGNEKKLNFDYKNFSKFKNKIEYLIIDDIPINVVSKKKNWQNVLYRERSSSSSYKPKTHKIYCLIFIKKTYKFRKSCFEFFFY